MRRWTLVAVAPALLAAACGGKPASDVGPAVRVDAGAEAVLAPPASRPTLVEPEAGAPASSSGARSGAADPAASAAPLDGPAPSVADGRVSPGAPTDAEIRAELAELQRVQARIERALAGPAGPIVLGSGRMIWPVAGPVVSPFGPRWGRLHAGIDIAVPTGRGIRAADAGIVALAGWVGGYGNYTCIRHTNELSTCYAHQSRMLVQRGEQVGQGQVIGAVGCTGRCYGPHLHFEVRRNGRPYDPLGFL